MTAALRIVPGRSSLGGDPATSLGLRYTQVRLFAIRNCPPPSRTFLEGASIELLLSVKGYDVTQSVPR